MGTAYAIDIDVKPAGMQRMICLEPALAKSGPKSLEVGGSWSASQTLTVAKM